MFRGMSMQIPVCLFVQMSTQTSNSCQQSCLYTGTLSLWSSLPSMGARQTASLTLVCTTSGKLTQFRLLPGCKRRQRLAGYTNLNTRQNTGPSAAPSGTQRPWSRFSTSRRMAISVAGSASSRPSSKVNAHHTL